jgi:multidrug efflux pump subunit AcrA (membrane-fusion protein)
MLSAAAAVVVVVCVAGTAYALTDDDGAPRKAASTAKAQRGTVDVTVSATGAVEPLESRKLRFTASATVTELTVRAGDQVKAGAVLARIDDAAVRGEVEAAESTVESAQEAVDKATTSSATSTATCVAPAAYASPSPSLSVGTSPSPVPSATATATAQPSRGTTTAPSRGGATTGCATGGAANTGRGGGSSSDPVLSAQQQLNNAKLTLEQARTKLAGTVITAPVDGRVLSVAGTTGGNASANSDFIVLAGTSDIAVRAQFTEAEVADLAVAQKVRITLPDRAGEPLTGAVLQIDPAGTTSNRLVRYAALMTFDAPPEGLLFGQSATVAVVTRTVSDVLYVPTTAVGADDTVTVRAHGRDERRTVGIGLRGDVSTEIRSGLQAGDEVLLNGR